MLGSKNNDNPVFRVLMVTDFPLREGEVVGGVAGAAHCLCKCLQEISGVDVDVLVPGCRIGSGYSAQLNGINVTYLPAEKESVWERFSHNRTATLVGEFAANGGYDIVHIQAAPEWSKELSGPVVVTLHGVIEQDMLYWGRNALLRKLLWPIVRFREQAKRAKIKNLIVISPYIETVMGAAFSGKRWPIENPVQHSFFEIVRRLHPHTILFAGVVTTRKNLIGLIRALDIIRHAVPDVVLKIAGSLRDIDYANACMAVIESLGLRQHVEFLGVLSVDGMQAELGKAHIMALSSFQETAPLSISESLAAGVPVVASDICGIPHMIKAGETGYLVDPDDIDDIAAGVLKAFQLDTALAEQACKREARARFNGEHIAERTLSVYRSLLGRS